MVCFEQGVHVLDAGGLFEEAIEGSAVISERLVDKVRDYIAVDISITHLLGHCLTEEPRCVDAGCPTEEQRVDGHDRHSGAGGVP